MKETLPANATGKMLLKDLLYAVLPQNLNLYKNTVSARHNKTKCNKARFGITQTVITRQSAQLTSIVFTITFPSVNQAQGPCITTR